MPEEARDAQPGLRVENDGEGDRALEDLGHDHARRLEEHVAGTRGRVAHDQDEHGILQRQQHQADVLKVVRTCSKKRGEFNVAL